MSGRIGQPAPTRTAKIAVGGDAHEVELVRRLAEGDREALAVLFGRYHQYVYALCFRMCGNEADAEDVTQEVFLRVMRHAVTFSARSRFSTWLFQVTRNACLDHARSATREREKRGRYAARLDRETSAAGESSGGATDRLVRALWDLEPRKREVVILKRFHGLSDDEIAEVCGCSPGAVRVRLHRALNTLRERYFDLERVEGTRLRD